MSVSLTAHHHPVLKFEMNGRTTPLLHTPAFLTKEKKKNSYTLLQAIQCENSREGV
jgi:hypothetical protein